MAAGHVSENTIGKLVFKCAADTLSTVKAVMLSA